MKGKETSPDRSNWFAKRISALSIYSRETATEEENDRLAMSYLRLRAYVGVIGIAFPFLLAIVAILFYQQGIQDTISDYYHTGARNLFVGVLCAEALFFLAYKGWEPLDDFIADLSAVSAVGVALAPTIPSAGNGGCGDGEMSLHFTFALIFFATLIYFSLFLFTKSKECEGFHLLRLVLTGRQDECEGLTEKKKLRNRIYVACGLIMLLCIVFIGIYFSLLCEVFPWMERYNPAFWLESLALLAFGVSWFTKGEALAILRDTPDADE